MRVSYLPAFAKSFKKLPRELQDEVVEKIELFKNPQNHTLLRVHKLHGRLKYRFSFSVNYQYRIVFRWLSKDEAVLLAVGDHAIYR